MSIFSGSKVSLLEIFPNRKKVCTKMFLLEFFIIVFKKKKGRVVMGTMKKNMTHLYNRTNIGFQI